MKLIRDAIEFLFVIAIGGMLVSASRSILSRKVKVYICSQCNRPTSRAYERCRHCNAQIVE
ncbi:hypothetical protein AXFE_13690 [Acidithrix ferrooxidans]|uniref:Uncharacterized protein n=1 Tax=Acidithrix ferrooxidans TaxID=1280514 RepID=A0A0D8HIJ0_9ACTN|nr:hypothetical protein AXFE_13690 [Acidithrix ferrooxidans]